MVLIQNIGKIFKAVCQDHQSSRWLVQSVAGHRVKGVTWGDLAMPAAVLPHGLWHETVCSNSCLLTGECAKTTQFQGMPRSLYWNSLMICIYLANYHNVSIFLERVHLELSESTHYEMMNVCVVDRKMLQRRNLAFPIMRCRHPH